MKRGSRDNQQSYNHLIHPDNPYFKNPPDFGFLAKRYEYLNDYVGENKDKTVYYKWEKNGATKMLTKALLKNDFGIEWDMPDSHLAPTLTLRINYLNWIHEILHLHPQYQNSDTGDTIGIDIGTGASCIFPILGNSLYHWSFVATDIDASSVASSQSIVEKNHLQNSVKVVQRTSDQPLLTDLLSLADGPVTFCMCNPPFYASKEEVGVNPHVSKEATDNELITPGGEYEFISRMIRESVELKQRVLLYTSLVAKKETLRRVLRLLREAKVPSVGTPVLGQGETVRWCVCWSFDEQFQKGFDAERIKYTVFGKQKELKKRQELSFHFDGGEDVVWERLKEFCNACDEIEMCQTDGENVCKVSNFVYHFPYGKGKERTGPVCCQFGIIVDVSQSGCDIHLQMQEGDRKLFFKVVEQLKNDVQRTSRRWRRLKLNT